MNASRTDIRTAARLLLLALVIVAAALAAPADAAAQEGVYRISQRASVSQTLGNTIVSLEYSRPLVRGRTDLFGGVVHWGELWTPGANEATVLEVNDTVKLDGHQVPPGRWSMWIIPSQVGPWELVLDARDTLFHTQRPELMDDQIRFVVDVEEGATHTEALAWSFPRIAQDGATMQMDWGTTRIPIEVEVRPNVPVLTVAPDTAALYVGEWAITFEMNPANGQEAPPTVLTVTHADDGKLLASFPPGVFAPPPDVAAAAAAAAADPDLTPQERERAQARVALTQPDGEPITFILVQRAHGVFLLGYAQDGDLLDVEEIYHEFEFDGGRAARLTIRGSEDQVFATATRKQ